MVTNCFSIIKKIKNLSVKNIMGNMAFAVAQKTMFKKGYEKVPAVAEKLKGHDFFGLQALDIDGKMIKFSEYDGKHRCFFIVNVASE